MSSSWAFEAEHDWLACDNFHILFESWNLSLTNSLSLILSLSVFFWPIALFSTWWRWGVDIQCLLEARSSSRLHPRLAPPAGTDRSAKPSTHPLSLAFSLSFVYFHSIISTFIKTFSPLMWISPSKYSGKWLSQLAAFISSLPLKVFGENHFEAILKGCWTSDLISKWASVLLIIGDRLQHFSFSPSG